MENRGRYQGFPLYKRKRRRWDSNPRAALAAKRFRVALVMASSIRLHSNKTDLSVYRSLYEIVIYRAANHRPILIHLCVTWKFLKKLPFYAIQVNRRELVEFGSCPVFLLPNGCHFRLCIRHQPPEAGLNVQ